MTVSHTQVDLDQLKAAQRPAKMDQKSNSSKPKMFTNQIALNPSKLKSWKTDQSKLDSPFTKIFSSIREEFTNQDLLKLLEDTPSKLLDGEMKMEPIIG